MLAVFGSKAARHLLHSKIKKKLATQAFLANRAANDFSQTEEPRTLLSCMNFPISFHIYGTEHSDELVPNVTEADVAELNQEFQTFFGDSCDDSAHDSSTVIRSFPTVELSSQDRTGLTHVDSEGKASMVDLSSVSLLYNTLQTNSREADRCAGSDGRRNGSFETEANSGAVFYDPPLSSPMFVPLVRKPVRRGQLLPQGELFWDGKLSNL